MNRIFLLVCLVIAFAVPAQATTIAYVVNSDTLYANLTFDRQWIDFFKSNMGYTVKVVTDDSAAAITNRGAYDGYFLSATMTSANLANLDTTSRGVVICDQLMYNTFHVASGQAPVALLGNDWYLSRFDSTHAITKYMSNLIQFSYSANSGSYGYTGIPQGAKVLYDPSNKEWDGEHGTPDTAFCYAIEAGDSLVGRLASGRRVVALSHYALMTSQSNAGYCHPYELMGNICGWAWGDEENQFNTNYNCYSTERATPPEVEQCWWEFGGTSLITGQGNEIFYNARFGFDEGYSGGGFLMLRYFERKVMPGFEIDSTVWSWNIRTQLPNYGVDSPPSGDLYSGFDLWIKLYKIIRTENWYTPLAYLNQGGNPYYIDNVVGSPTYGQTLWRGYNRANRTFITTGPLSSDSVRWSTIGLAPGVDYAEAALDSFRCNATTFPSDGSVTIRFVIPGDVFNDPNYNGFVWKTFDLTGLSGTDSTDIELISSALNSIRDLRAQKFESYLSEASPQTLGVADTTYTLSGELGSFANSYDNYNTVVNTGDGVIEIDSVVDNQSWLFLSNTSGITNLAVVHVLDTTGLGAGSDTATVLVYASGADNSPLTYYVIYVLSSPPVEIPPASIDRRTGLLRRDR